MLYFFLSLHIHILQVQPKDSHTVRHIFQTIGTSNDMEAIAMSLYLVKQKHGQKQKVIAGAKLATL